MRGAHYVLWLCAGRDWWPRAILYILHYTSATHGVGALVVVPVKIDAPEPPPITSITILYN